jgi:ABC-type lipoprotein release transport system permease subunit
MIRTSLPLLITLSWRNLWRHTRRTLVILSAITLGVWFMIISAAMMVGIIEQQLNDTIANLVGHAQIHNPKYRDDPAIENSMPPPTKKLLEVLNSPPVTQWTARVRLPAVVMSERESRGVTLVGIDQMHEKGLSLIGKPVVAGRSLQGKDDTGIIIGRRLAEKLETGLGKRIVVMTQNRNDEVADRGFRIVGLYQAELESTETAYAFTGIHTVQKMVGMGNDISEISLMTSSRDNPAPLIARLHKAAPQLESLSWQQLEPLLVQAMKVYDNFMVVWYFIIFFAMAFGLTNTMLMAVFERTREIGLFQALGMRPRFIVGQVLMETLILLFIGIALGNLTGWFTTNVLMVNGIDLSNYATGMEQFNMASVMYFHLRVRDLVEMNLLVIVLGLVASLYPAVKAARFVPVEAITRT